MRWLIYNLALIALSPAIAIWLLYRLVIRSGSREGFGQRLGLVPRLPESEGVRVWVHAVSAGEVVAAAPFVRALIRRIAGCEVIVSTITPAGAAQARRLVPEAREVIYFPLDLPLCVSRALARVRPTLFVAVETEIWPTFYRTASGRGIPVALVNARVSDRSFGRLSKGWGRCLRPLYAATLDHVQRFAAQSDVDVERLVALGADRARISICGNTKFDQEIPRLSAAKVAAYRRALGIQGHQRLWIAGSTHPGEEEAVLNAWMQVRASAPDLALMIAPRHIMRADAVESLCREFAGRIDPTIPVIRRSTVDLSDQEPGPQRRDRNAKIQEPASPPIVLLDTVGELASFYALGDVAFVGGSLAPIGGHDVLQPLLHGRPTFFGPHMHNQRDLASLVTRAGAAGQVADTAALAEAVRAVLCDPPSAESMTRAIADLFAANQGAADRCAEQVEAMLGLAVLAPGARCARAWGSLRSRLWLAALAPLAPFGRVPDAPEAPQARAQRAIGASTESPRRERSEPQARPKGAFGAPSIVLNNRPRILLVRLSAIGDVVVATPVIRALREAYPEAEITWLVEDKAADIVRGNPELDEVIVWPRGAWRRELRGPIGALRRLGRWVGLVRRLRRCRFDVAIDLQGLLRSALMTRISGARWRVASEGTREGSRWLYNCRVPREQDPSSRQRCLDLLQPLGIRSRRRQMWVSVDRADESAAEELLSRLGVDAVPFVALCPATTWRHKHWGEEKWSSLADSLVSRCGVRVVFMGAAADRPLLERIQARMTEPAASAAGATTLKQAAVVLTRAKLVIAVDTALMHVGVAVGTPVIGVCGPSNWPSFQDYENFRLVRRPYECSPCLRHPTCANDDCMTTLGAEELFGEARLLLERSERFLRML